MKPKVRKFILNFIKNYKKYDSTEENAKTPKKQAEEFKISMKENNYQILI